MADAVAIVVQVLACLSLPPSDLDQLPARLVETGADQPIEALGLDSLGSMEFCIELELGHGILLSPEELLEMQTTQKLLLWLQARLDSMQGANQEDRLGSV